MDSSENIYVCGFTNSYGAGGQDIALIKYNNLGERQWNITWGGINNDSARAIALDSSNNIYITGYYDATWGSKGDMILLKYDNSGQLQWNATWGGSDFERGNAIALDNSENIYIAGQTSSFGAGAEDMVLVKYNNLGQQQWNTTWGGITYDSIFSIVVDSSDNIYATGITTSFGAGSLDFAIWKYNNLGQLQWFSPWGGSGYEHAWAIALDSSDNLYICGHTSSFGAGGTEIAFVKYDSLGQQQWNTTWGGVSEDRGENVVVDSSENIYIMGTTRSFGAGGNDMVLIKYSESSGEIIPGYDLFLLIGSICVISTIIIKKHHNQQSLKKKVLKLNK
ncbi:hypothetical protein ES708_14806 [subsurface metagenome]